MYMWIIIYELGCLNHREKIIYEVKKLEFSARGDYTVWNILRARMNRRDRGRERRRKTYYRAFTWVILEAWKSSSAVGEPMG